MAHMGALALACRVCGNDMLFVGKLPAIGLQAAVHVFKCQTCLTVHAQKVIKTTGAEEVVAI